MIWIAAIILTVGVQDPTPKTRLLQGQVVCDGIDAVSGSLRLHFWRGDNHGITIVRVRDGAWSEEIPWCERVGLAKMSLNTEVDGVIGLFPLEPDRQWTLPMEGMLIGHFGRPVPFGLDVVDSHTEARLEPYSRLNRYWVEAYFRDEILPDQVVPGGGSTARAELRHSRDQKSYHVASPRPLVLFVWARGYATQRIELDPLAGGRHGVALEPGGGLSVEIEGQGPRMPGARLRVWDDRGRLVFECPYRSSLGLQSLPIGNYRVAVEGQRQVNPLRFGEVHLAVQPGELAEATLRLHEARAEPIRLAGTLAIPEAWDSADWRVILNTTTLHPEREVELRVADLPRDAAGRLIIAMDDAVPDRWTVVIPEIIWMGELDVGPDGLQGFALDVPPPQTLRVRVVEEGTDERADIRMLIWWCDGVGDDARRVSWRGALLEKFVHTDAEGMAVIQVPQGRVALEPWSWIYESAEPWFVVGNEPLDVRLDMVPLGGIRVHWTGLGKWPVRLKQVPATVTREDGTLASPRKTGVYHDGISICLDPGRYLVKFHQPPGCKPIEAIQIDVPTRGLIPLEVAIVRDE